MAKKKPERTASESKRKLKDSVKVYRFETMRPSGGDDDYKAWRHLSGECREIVNRVRPTWEREGVRL